MKRLVKLLSASSDLDDACGAVWANWMRTMDKFYLDQINALEIEWRLLHFTFILILISFASSGWSSVFHLLAKSINLFFSQITVSFHKSLEYTQIEIALNSDFFSWIQ